MTRKMLGVPVAGLFALNVGLLLAAPTPATNAGDNWGQCACSGGSDPSGPQGPYVPFCMVFLDETCDSDSDCSCPLG